MMLRGLVIALTLFFALSGCNLAPVEDRRNSPADGVSAVAAPEENPLDMDLLRAMSAAGALAPLEQASPDPELVELGRLLFFDPILSGNKDVSCASCHRPAHGTSDQLPLSIGTTGAGSRGSYTPRNVPPLYNLGALQSAFWDGRVERDGEHFGSPGGDRLPTGLDSVLAAQTMMTAVSRIEMRGRKGDRTVTGEPNELAALADHDLKAQWSGLMRRLLAYPEYQALFRKAYPELLASELGFQHAANALAAFQMDQFHSGSSPFDRYVGGDDSALTEQQKRGGLLFYGRARCSGCHRGPLLTDFRFHNVGAPQLGPGMAPHEPLDLGRAEVTGRAEDRFRFRTPSLRNVGLTGPWTHAGGYSSLREVVEHYLNPAESLKAFKSDSLPPAFRDLVQVTEQIEAGGLDTLSPIAGAPIKLSEEEIEALVSFLHALTDSEVVKRASSTPPRVPSGLATSNRRLP